MPISNIFALKANSVFPRILFFEALLNEAQSVFFLVVVCTLVDTPINESHTFQALAVGEKNRTIDLPESYLPIFRGLIANLSSC